MFPLLQAPLEPVLGALLDPGGPNLELKRLRDVLSAHRPNMKHHGGGTDEQGQKAVRSEQASTGVRHTAFAPAWRKDGLLTQCLSQWLVQNGAVATCSSRLDSPATAMRYTSA